MRSRSSHKIYGYFLIILFCGYFGSTSLFPHSHVVDGVTIVHSHPFKSSPGGAPVKHNHSTNGFHLIQFISGFIATASVLFIVDAVIRKVLSILLPLLDENIRVNLKLSPAHRPRAPTFFYTISPF